MRLRSPRSSSFLSPAAIWLPVGLPVAALAVGCISEDDFKAVVAERDQLMDKVDQLEEELDVAKGRIKELEKLAEKASEVPSRPPVTKVRAAMAQLKLPDGGKLVATLDTTLGPVTCTLYPDIAPETVLNFVGLAEGTKEWVDPATGSKTVEPLYNGTKFHRVIKGFMVQGGDPKGNGTGGPGYQFGDEVWADVKFDKPGRLAMANSGPSTNGSQFFITEVPTPHLNGKHTIFGDCDLETIKKMVAVDVGGPQGSTPVEDIILKKVTVERKAPASQGG